MKIMNKELKIGTFAVAVLVASFFLINYLRGEDIFNREIEVYAEFADLQGLVESAPVYIKGYKAGKVSDIAYDSEAGIFNVCCSVIKEFSIPQDSRMTIYSVDIMGGKGVRIDLGSSADLAADGDMLTPSFEAGLMDGLASSVGPLMEKLQNTLDSLSVTVSGVNQLLSPKNLDAVSGTLAHLERTLANVNRFSASINGKSAEIENMITNLSAMSEKLDGLADSAGNAIGGATAFVNTLNESDIEGVIRSLKDVLENINDPDGTIGKLFVDNSVYNSVDQLLSDIDSLVNKIQENPKKYLKISVF